MSGIWDIPAPAMVRIWSAELPLGPVGQLVRLRGDLRRPRRAEAHAPDRVPGRERGRVRGGAPGHPALLDGAVPSGAQGAKQRDDHDDIAKAGIGAGVARLRRHPRGGSLHPAGPLPPQRRQRHVLLRGQGEPQRLHRLHELGRGAVQPQGGHRPQDHLGPQAGSRVRNILRRQLRPDRPLALGRHRRLPLCHHPLRREDSPGPEARRPRGERTANRLQRLGPPRGWLRRAHLPGQGLHRDRQLEAGQPRQPAPLHLTRRWGHRLGRQVRRHLRRRRLQGAPR
mmetsp:Transcript_121962/g.379647  ORF Transcript_121962/g.379647 Transcript_121962/m.379647 type:complete len:283 (+) Transcript_121962:495-1343(+)